MQFNRKRWGNILEPGKHTFNVLTSEIEISHSILPNLSSFSKFTRSNLFDFYKWFYQNKPLSFWKNTVTKKDKEIKWLTVSSEKTFMGHTDLYILIFEKDEVSRSPFFTFNIRNCSKCCFFFAKLWYKCADMQIVSLQNLLE